MYCPKCGSELRGAVVCPSCDDISDESVLKEDALTSEVESGEIAEDVQVAEGAAAEPVDGEAVGAQVGEEAAVIQAGEVAEGAQAVVEVAAGEGAAEPAEPLQVAEPSQATEVADVVDTVDAEQALAAAEEPQAIVDADEPKELAKDVSPALVSAVAAEVVAELRKSPLKVEAVGGFAEKGLSQDAPRADMRNKILRTVLALAIALVSFFAVAPVLSSPEFHADTLATLDEKRANVVALAAASAGASVTIELLPLPDPFGDVGNAIAAELAGLSSDFGIIVAAILLEKYLLTVLALAAFKVLVPLACVLYAAGAWRPRLEPKLGAIATKMVALAVVLMLVVPLSVQVSQIIDETFETSVAMAEAGLLDENAAELDETVADEGLWNRITGALNDATDTAANATEWATLKLENLMEAFAVMLITSCVIPILVVVLALWAVNLILGVNVQGPMNVLKNRSWRAPVLEKRGKAMGAVKELIGTDDE